LLAIARVGSAQASFTEYPQTCGVAWGITAGPDGAMWFAEWQASKIGRITASGVISEYPLTPGCGPEQIAPGPDGGLWFTEYDGNKIGRITTAGVITEFSLSGAAGFAGGIAAGPDGNLWFTESGKIGRITTAGVVSEYPLPTPGNLSFGIAAGPDGAMWFTQNFVFDMGYAGRPIGRLSLSASAPAAAPVPSLSTWGLAVLMMLIVAIGTRQLRGTQHRL
jgi:streptogramin lyase